MSFPDVFHRGRNGSSSGHSYKDVHIDGDAKAHLGDSYNFRLDSPLSSLPYAKDAPFNSYAKQHDPTCLKSTRVELLREIYEWAEGRDERCIFWLSGLAGTGKSTIARTVARTYFDRNSLGASFFFSRGGGDVGHAGRFVTSTALQLASGIRGIQQYICDAITERKDITNQSLRDQWHQLILRPLSKLDGCSCQSVYVLVIDALDECDDDNNIRIILHLLAEVRSLQTVRIRVFLTSRPELSIRHGFRYIADTEHHDFVLHNISPSVVDQDISIFLEYNLNLIGQDDAQEPGWPGLEALQHLVQTASGLFIWAATACRFIREGLSTDERLQILLEGGNTPATPEEHLNEIYITVLWNSIQPGYTELERQRLYSMLKDVLGGIVILFSPLSVKSLCKLLCISEQQVDRTLKNLHAILDIPNDEAGLLRVHHPSFRDFLLHSDRCKDPNFWVDEKQAHKMLADSCIRLMSNTLKQDICELNALGMLVIDVESSRVKRSLPPEVQYACLYWALHLQNSGTRLQDNDQVYQFLQEHLLHWFEALGWIGKVSEGIYAIIALESIITAYNCPQLARFVYDAKRFILYSRPAIEQAPLQIYFGALIFAPTRSVVRKQFNYHLSRWVRRSLEVEDNWNALLQTLEGHSDRVNAVAFSPDGKLLATASSDKTIKLWDASSGAVLQTLEGHSEWVIAVTFLSDGRLLASAADDQTVKLWDVGSGVSLQTLEGHSDWLNTVAFSPDGKLLVSVAADDRKVKLWDLGSGAVLQILEGHSRPVRVALSLDSKLLVIASGEKIVEIRDASSGVALQTLKGHWCSVSAVAFSPDSKLLATASSDIMPSSNYIIKLCDVGSGAVLQTLEGHSDWISAVTFSPDGKLLASAADDHIIKLWDAGSGAVVQMFEGHLDLVSAVAFSPDGKLLASTSGDQTVKMWDIGLGAASQTLESHSCPVTAVVFSPDGKLLVIASGDEAIKLWDAGSGTALQTPKGYLGWISVVTFSPDSKLLALVSNDRVVKLWDIGSGVVLQILRDHSLPVHSIAFSLDSKLLVIASGDKTAELWDAGSGAALHTLKGHSRLVRAVAFSLDSKLLATASSDKTIKLWDVGLGVALQTLEGHSNWVNTVAFSPDGKILASAADDRVIKLWNVGSGTLLQTLEGYSDRVNAVAFSRDSKLLATASNDKTIKLWDAGSGVVLQILNIDAVVQTLLFSNDGTFFQTNRGLLPTAVFLDQAAQPDLSRSMFVKQQWVSCGMENVLWLPPEHRPSHVAVHNAVVAFGYASGRVLFMELAF